MRTGAQYPTAEHEAASRAIVDFSKAPDGETVILTVLACLAKRAPLPSKCNRICNKTATNLFSQLSKVQ